MNRPRPQPIGVILAGGRGRRIGGAKATVLLGGQPLISYPLEALSAVLEEVVVLAKADTELPSLPGTTVWIETDARHHPAIGIVQALGLAGGRPILVCAVDLPFVTPAIVRALASADPDRAAAAVACSQGRTQPLLGCYQPRVVDVLEPGDERPLRDQVAALSPQLVEVADPRALFNVNAPEDLLQAAAMLGRSRTF
jgi:molybdopterin-guanine dinucleotide biosynthesis protein A